MASLIRLAAEADAGALLAIYAPLVRDTAISFELEPPSLDDMRQRVRRTIETFPWLVFDREGEVRGYAYATSHRTRAAYRWSVDVSVYVHEAARRGGVARSLYRSLFALLALQGFCNAYAGIALPNPASVGFHESMGFEPVGIYRAVGYKLGRWHDVGWWFRELRERPASPEPPRAHAAVKGSPAWNAALARGVATTDA